MFFFSTLTKKQGIDTNNSESNGKVACKTGVTEALVGVFGATCETREKTKTIIDFEFSPLACLARTSMCV